MKKFLAAILLFTVSIYAQEFTLDFKSTQTDENFSIKLNFKIDENGKLLNEQKYDIRNIPSIKSLKVITASGLLGTLKDEREIIAYYKTSLNVGGLKIRNLYKAAIARVYDNETTITLNFDPDHYQNIISYLRYHNIKQDVINDIDNMYGTWEEIE